MTDMKATLVVKAPQQELRNLFVFFSQGGKNKNKVGSGLDILYFMRDTSTEVLVGPRSSVHKDYQQNR